MRGNTLAESLINSDRQPFRLPCSRIQEDHYALEVPHNHENSRRIEKRKLGKSVECRQRYYGCSFRVRCRNYQRGTHSFCKIEEGKVLKIIEEEVAKMIKFCEVQKNANMIIKEGLKNLQFFIREAKEQHKKADNLDENLETVVGYDTYDGEQRNGERDRKHAKALNSAVPKRKIVTPKTKSEEQGNENEEGILQSTIRRRMLQSQFIRKVRNAQQLAPGKTYAEVLTSNTQVVEARPTEKGNSRIKIRRFFKPVGEMHKADRRVILKILDLDYFIQVTEVRGVLCKAVGK